MEQGLEGKSKDIKDQNEAPKEWEGRLEKTGTKHQSRGKDAGLGKSPFAFVGEVEHTCV